MGVRIPPWPTMIFFNSRKIERVKEKVEDNLIVREEVVAVGIGRKQVKGKWTRKKAILIFVKKKVDVSSLDATDVIPKKIEGCCTDVIEVGELEEMQIQRQRERPALWGSSCMWYKGTACTLGAKVWKNGKAYILGNAHCYFPFWKGAKKGEDVWQPSRVDGGSIEDKIGTVFEVAPFSFEESNLVDAALALIINPFDVSNEIMEIGVPSPTTATVKIGEIIQKFGRTSGYTKGKVISVKTTATVRYGLADGTKKVVRFKDQIFTQKMVDGGDSSSLALNMKKQPIGLCYAGSEVISIFNTIQNVQAALKFSFVPSEKGWVAAKYLEFKDIIRTKTNLNVREAPALNAIRLATLSKDTAVEIIVDEKNGTLADGYYWWRIQS